MSTAYLDLFEPAIEAVRGVLGDLDDDQIPADLRRVVRSSGGRLPPPLALAALRGLDRYPWLRDRVAEALDGDPDEEGPVGASWLLVRRPDGWSSRLAGRGFDAGVLAGRRDTDHSEARARDLEQRVEAAKSAARAQAAEAASEITRLEGALEAERAAKREQQAAEARTEAGKAERIAELEATLEREHQTIEGLRAAVDRERREVRRLRAERNTLHAALAEASTSPGWLGDTTSLARHLDDLAAMARVSTTTEVHEPAARPRGRLALPVGIRPDSAAAVSWLVALDEPVTVIIDGYNAGFHLVGSTDPAPARRRLGIEVDRIARLATGPLRVVVIYDSSVDAESSQPGRGPEVRFTEPGTPADEEIARLSAALTGSVVVISSDRWVREVAEAAGALALWSEALVAWASQR